MIIYYTVKIITLLLYQLKQLITSIKKIFELITDGNIVWVVGALIVTVYDSQDCCQIK